MASNGGGSSSIPTTNGASVASGGHHDAPGSHRRRSFTEVAVSVTSVCMALGISYIVLSQSAYNPAKLYLKTNSFSNRGKPSSPFFRGATTPEMNAPSIKLKDVLQKTAMKSLNTVIITTLNDAWAKPDSIFDLFLDSFIIGNQTEHLFNHVMVVALDQNAYSYCMNANLHCYALTTKGVDFSGEKRFMSEDYLKMMWRRIEFLRGILEMGYNFIFTDADVLWLRDPFLRFYPDGDFQIACDHYGYDSSDLRNSPNGGFNYVKSNNRTIQFYKYWYSSRLYFPGKHDQDVLNEIKFSPFVRRVGLDIRFLDTNYFGGFCEPSKDLDLVVTMHANCCVGLENKIHDMKMVVEDWKRYMASYGGGKNKRLRIWTGTKICGRNV